MVSAFQYFVAYLIVDALCIALTIIIASNVSRDSGSETQVRYFFLVLTTFLVFLIFDAVWAFTSSGSFVVVSEAVLSVVNGINLTAIAFAAYFWLCFTLTRFGSPLTNSRKLRLAAAIPVFLVPVLHIIGYFTGQNVIFNDDGSLSYGAIHLAITCILLAYIIVASVYSLIQFKKAETRSNRRMALTFTCFMLPFVVAGIVDSFIAGTPIVSAWLMVSLSFVMTSLQKARISTDALTGLNNRRRADEYLEESIQHVSPEIPLYLFIMDLDKFKKVNDKYGHLEGDHALKLMANALRLACAHTNAFAARWGGDEFIVICTETKLEPDRISEIITNDLADTVNEADLEYPLTCSIGYALCTSPDATSTDVTAKADANLYEVKKAHGKKARR